MKPNFGRALLAVIVALPVVLIGRVASAEDRGDPLALEIVEAAKKALGKTEAVRFHVRTPGGYPVDSGSRRIDGLTIFTAERARPGKYTGRFIGPAGDVHHVIVSDGNGMLYSAYGKIASARDRASYAPIMGTTGDFAAVARIFIDASYFDNIVKRSRLLLAGTDMVEEDVCDLIIAIQNEPSRFLTTVTTLWFSRESHLPRGIETRMYLRGSMTHVDRRFIGKIELIDSVDPKIFEMVVKPEQTVPVGPSVPAPVNREGFDNLSYGIGGRPNLPTTANAEVKPLVGRDVRDLLVKAPGKSESIKLAEVLSGGTGKPDQELTLLTFWSTWKASARAELETANRLEGLFSKNLRVVAIGIADDPKEILRYIKQKPDYRFTYLLDPEWTNPGETRIKKEFMITTLPTNVLVDSKGVVVDAWRGRLLLAEARARVANQLKSDKKP